MKPHRMVAAARAISQISQEELAERLAEISGKPWTRANVAALENGRRAMRVEELEWFAKAQGRDIAWYLTPEPSDELRPYLTQSGHARPLALSSAS